MTPQSTSEPASVNTLVRCQHCYSNLINIKGEWYDGKTRTRNCPLATTEQTIPHKPLPKV